MKAYGKLALLRDQPLEFISKALRRLGFFPFTLVQVLFNAAIEVKVMRPWRKPPRVGIAADAAPSLPCHVMMWLTSDAASEPVDVCLQLPRDATDANLHDVFSVMLACEQVQSIALYWDASGLSDDLLLMQPADKRDRAVSRPPFQSLGVPSPAQFESFIRADSGGITLPVAAVRDAQTLLKRLSGSGQAVCLNHPSDLRDLSDAVARRRPDVRYFDFTPDASSGPAITNKHALAGAGLTLHERMAVVQTADAYVGKFDELGCTALIARRPAVLLGGGVGVTPDHVIDRTLWLPQPLEPEPLAAAALEFLSGHLAQGQTTVTMFVDARTPA